MARLQRIGISFVTHGLSVGAFWGDSVVHVFVRNRLSDTSRATPTMDFVSNLADYQAKDAAGPFDLNQYLGCALGLRPLNIFDTGNSEGFEIPLRTQPIPLEEVVLPVVDVHLYSPVDLQWEFSYTITFDFDDGRSFSDTSDKDGITSILLDNNNANYSGICVENPFFTPSAQPRPPSTPIYLKTVTLTFGTHGDDKARDTRLNVHIANRKSATSNQDIAIGTSILAGQSFPQGSSNKIIFGEGGALPLASPYIQLQEMMLPIVYVSVYPTGGDRWIFDHQVTYKFDNDQEFTSRTNGVSLNASSNKHAGVYNGSPFPAMLPPKKRSEVWEPTWVQRHKDISFSYVSSKIAELFARPGLPYIKLKLGSVDDYGTGARASYYDLATITPDPPSPGTPSPPGISEGVRWSSSPTSIGFLDNGVSFPSVDSSLAISLDPASPMPIGIRIDFETPFNLHVTGPLNVGLPLTVTTFWIEIHFTLDWDSDNQKVDALSWMRDPAFIAFTDLFGMPDTVVHDGVTVVKVDVKVIGPPLVPVDLGGMLQKRIREKILNTFFQRDALTGKTTADKLNEHVNGWLLGGVISGTPNRSFVTGVSHDPGSDTVRIDYNGPRYTPPEPFDWPTGIDFSSGALSNIEHIVVVTKENHSFDSMLGYLSLPVIARGQGRTDVDGLKGDEFNMLAGRLCSSFAFEPEDTIFSPNPPQDSQRTLWEVDGGRMGGFVEAFADENGINVAPRIMGYYTATNVPVYDALSRDFAICQRWFAPHPGPTFPNRFYELTGWLNMTPDGLWVSDNTTPLPELDYSSPKLPAVMTTIFDHLPDNVTWRYFEQGYCFLRLFADYTFDSEHIVSLNDPEIGFYALAKRGELPNVSFIDPHFIDWPPDATCDEPPSDVRDGQQFVRKIVEAVVCSPNWEKTMLIITYDEHGGFFDHVPPPRAAKVRAEAVDTYGVRVPTFVISPWIRGGSVFGHDGPVATPPGPVESIARTAETAAAAHAPGGALAALHFDHTSILKTIARTFLSDNPPFLGKRYAEARDLSSIMLNEPRTSEFRPFVPYTLVYSKSGKALEVEHGGFSAGTKLWQNNPDATDEAQLFRFEDASDGSWYLRTHTGDMYVTADGTATIVQERKYPADGASGDPDSQHWLVTTGITPGSGFTIRNAASTEKTLQPVDNSQNAGAAVTLGDPGGAVGVHVPNAWRITSPLLPDPGIHVAHP